MNSNTATVIIVAIVAAYAALLAWIRHRHPPITDEQLRELIRQVAAIHAVHQRAMARRDNQPTE